MPYSSKIVEDAVNAFSRLPSIGKKSALRLVLHLIKQDKEFTQDLTEALTKLKEELKECTNCYNLSDQEICDICSNPRRNQEIICVVESVRDVMAIEETDQYNGLYHVLGGVISPLDGIGVEDIQIKSLLTRLDRESVKEVILGLSPTIEGDTTIFYLAKQIDPLGIKLSMLSRGVAFGGELEYTDGLTLGRSILSRVAYSVNNEIIS